MPPVGQIAKGVFVVAPGNVETYKDTVGGGYVSAFTKARADQWELSLKEAASKVQNAEQRFKYQMDAYQERLADLERRRAQAAIDIDKFNADAANAAKEFNAKSEAERQQDYNKLVQRRAELTAKLTYVEPGGTRTSTRTATGTGGTPAEKAADYKLSQKEQDEIGAATTAGTTAEKVQRFTDKVAQASVLPMTSPEQTKAVRHAAVEQMIAQRASENKITAAQAEPLIIKELSDLGETGLISDYAEVDQVKATGGGGKTTQTATTTPGKVARRAYGEIAAPTMAELTAIEAEQINKQKALEAYDTTLATLRETRPDLPETDLIYTARRLMQKNFGPTRSAQESAFDQRRVLDMLLRASPEQRAGILARYKQMAPSAPTVSGEGPPVAIEPSAPVTPPPAAPTTRGVSPGVTAGTVPVGAAVDVSGISPGTTATEGGVSTRQVGTATPDVAMTPSTSITGDTLTPFESVDEMRARSARARLRSLAYGVEDTNIQSSIPTETDLTREPVTGPVTSPSVSRVMSSAPTERLVEVGGQVYTPEEVKAKVAEIDRMFALKPEDARLGLAEGLVQKGKERIPLTKSEIASVRARASEVPEPAAQIKDINEEPFGEGSRAAIRNLPEPETQAQKDRAQQVKYILERTAEAKELASTPNKLARLSASGPGLDAKKLWTSNKDLKTALDELTLKYSNDLSKLKLAHTVLIAIDLASKKTTEIPKAGE